MHKARHTAGERVLDRTGGNLTALQRLLGHADISPLTSEATGEIVPAQDSGRRLVLPPAPPVSASAHCTQS